MTVDDYKKIFASHGSVYWNGGKYKAKGMKVVRVQNELIFSALISGDNGRINYWVSPEELSSEGVS